VQALLSDSASLGVFTTGLMRHAPVLRKRLVYTFFWALVLAIKVRLSRMLCHTMLCCAVFIHRPLARVLRADALARMYALAAG
jgi:hypothetical protein